ncbi:hypothetical protein I4U23_009348 [Adineta vaga]|nr:hypothetical protein I4U23_009348 [Adineta vaga]
MSTPISSASTSIEDCIGLQYACRKTSLTNSHILRSSHVQQQSTHLRRLHSKSKVRSNSNFYKTFSNAPRKKSLTSSIAHRIELLKQAMENNELEVHQQKLVKNSTLKLSSSTSPINIINKQTQTNTSQSQLSEIHYIHHHHIHSSSMLSFEWRTYLSVIGTIILLILLFMQFITIHF